MSFNLFEDTLAYDGSRLISTCRSLLSHASKYNFVTNPMLRIRSDTPRRVGKKARLGLDSFVTRCPGIALDDLWRRARENSIDEPPEFFNDAMRLVLVSYGGSHTVDGMVEVSLERKTIDCA